MLVKFDFILDLVGTEKITTTRTSRVVGIHHHTITLAFFTLGALQSHYVPC